MKAMLLILTLICFQAFGEDVLTVEEYDQWLAKEQAQGRWLDVNKPKAPVERPQNKVLKALGVGLQTTGESLQGRKTVKCVTDKVGEKYYTDCR